MQIAGFMFILLGVITKIGAILATIPDPVIGGVLAISCGVVGGVGLSSIQMVDLRLSRNAAVLGLAIIFGILVPSYIDKSPISTGEIPSKNFNLPGIIRYKCFRNSRIGPAFEHVTWNTNVCGRYERFHSR